MLLAELLENLNQALSQTAKLVQQLQTTKMSNQIMLVVWLAKSRQRISHKLLAQQKHSPIIHSFKQILLLQHLAKMAKHIMQQTMTF